MKASVCLVALLWVPTACDEVSPSGEEWHAERFLRIGRMDDPRYGFYRIVGVARDAAGRFYAADAGWSRIRVYDRDGTYVRDIGGEGDGPGEFRNLSAISLLGDTVYALSHNAARATYFDTAGAVLFTEQRPAQRTTALIRPALPSIQFETGRAIAWPRYVLGQVRFVPMLLTDRRGTVVDTLAQVDVTHGAVEFRQEKRATFIQNPFAPLVSAPFVSGDGAYIARIVQYPDGGLAPGQFSIDVGQLEGAAVWSTLIRVEPIEYVESVVDSVVSAVLRPIGSLVSEAEYRKAVQIPAYQPPVRSALLTPSGSVWVGLTQADQGEVQWMEVNADAAPTRRVRLSTRCLPFSIVGDTVFAVERDEWDVQYVVGLRLVRGAA